MKNSSSYSELQVTSNYSFLRGASHPEELASRSKELGYKSIAITDRNTLAGVVRMHTACKKHNIRMIVGARLDFIDSYSLLCFPQNRNAYGRLAKLISLGKRRTKKGACELFLKDVIDNSFFQQGKEQILIILPPKVIDNYFADTISKLTPKIKGDLYLAISYFYNGYDKSRLSEINSIAKKFYLPLVATNNVKYHAPNRKPLQDVLTCIRKKCRINNAGFLIEANAERYLKSTLEIRRLFLDYPDAITNTSKIYKACNFNLDELRYEYPVYNIRNGVTPQQELTRLTWKGAKERYPKGTPEKIKKQIGYELSLIEELQYAPYFLTIYDIVQFARTKNILCQGRGSAANSSVCYVLGITSVNPSEIDLLFERFISSERNEPPDIDVDFEHERREEVIQYIYEKYGRNCCGITATHVTYRYKSAFQEIGKVMGLSKDVLAVLSATSRWGGSSIKNYIREAGLNPEDPTLSIVLQLSEQILGFPRHLSQHTGGFVITKGPLDNIVPIENARMKKRTVIEWDKDDLDTLGILKVDILALGMLTCIRKAFDEIKEYCGQELTLANIPQGDQDTYDMICNSDSIGVFQIESRAQMSMLPRLRPRNYYDLVIQVAIVRPGPIQGDMVHPYLKRRNNQEHIYYPKKSLEKVLKKTLGVPLFQEQAMRIAIEAAGFTPNEADGLRRAMATFRRNGNLPMYRKQFIKGMVKNGYKISFAEKCFNQIEGFGDYGFPESHAASFALLVYISAWLKCHYPAAFAAAILNSQPMGFYNPAQLIQDAKNHGVEVLEVDINSSNWEYKLEKIGNIVKKLGEWRTPEDAKMSLRIGIKQIKGIEKNEVKLIVNQRNSGYSDISEIKSRTGIKRRTLETLARADTFHSLGINRRKALWIIRGLSDEECLPLFQHLGDEELQPEPSVKLPIANLGSQVLEDYKTLRFSLKSHPMTILRKQFRKENYITCKDLGLKPNGSMVLIAGLVLVRQRPGSANGVIFITLEDETGMTNLIVWNQIKERYRKILFTSKLLGVYGKLQRENKVTHIISQKLFDHSNKLDNLGENTNEQESRIVNKKQFTTLNPREFK